MSTQTHTASHAENKAARETLELSDSAPFRWAVRIGFGARGLTYALIGAIAIALAVGAGATTAPDQQGALQLVAGAPLGALALIVIAVGLGAYALWKLILAALGTGPEGAGGDGLTDRLSNLAGGVVYLAFCALAVRVVLGQGGNQTRAQRHTAAGVLGWPAGRELVAGAGIVLIAICAQQIYMAVSGRFAQESKVGEMAPEERRAFMALGRVGLTARSLVFGLSGYFLIRSAIDYKVSQGISLDGTLAKVHGQAYGSVLLLLVGAGLLLFAAFSLLEARRRRL